MSMYKGKTRFNREQLLFIADVMITSCVDTVESALPQSPGDQKDYKQQDANEIASTAIQSLGWNLSILYAQLTDDGISGPDVTDAILNIDQLLDMLVAERFDPTWEGLKVGVKVHDIDTRRLAEIYVERMFEDKPDDYLNDKTA